MSHKRKRESVEDRRLWGLLSADLRKCVKTCTNFDQTNVKHHIDFGKKSADVRVHGADAPNDADLAADAVDGKISYLDCWVPAPVRIVQYRDPDKINDGVDQPGRYYHTLICGGALVLELNYREKLTVSCRRSSNVEYNKVCERLGLSPKQRRRWIINRKAAKRSIIETLEIMTSELKTINFNVFIERVEPMYKLLCRALAAL